MNVMQQLVIHVRVEAGRIFQMPKPITLWFSRVYMYVVVKVKSAVPQGCNKNVFARNVKGSAETQAAELSEK